MNEPIPMLLWCPECGDRHIDVGEFATKVHHTHACQSCGMVWRPAVVPTVGVQWLPGFKDGQTARPLKPLAAPRAAPPSNPGKHVPQPGDLDYPDSENTSTVKHG